MSMEVWQQVDHDRHSCVGIRAEDKSPWERRTPLAPEDVRALIAQGIEVRIQPSTARVYPIDEFLRAGATIDEKLDSCPVVLGIKEINPAAFRPGGTYVFFSHTVKGQPKNMPMLKRLLELGCTLIDYEKVTDENGRRLIFFGTFAGMAGIVETLVALGRRLLWEGIPNPLSELKRPVEYEDLAHAKSAVAAVGQRILEEGFHREFCPVVVGFAGYGNVARGAWEIMDLLPTEEISPEELCELCESDKASNRVLYKVVFREIHTVEPFEPGHAFDLNEYYAHPERYRGVFERYLPWLTALVNCIYWEPRYPRLVTKQALRRLFEPGRPKPRLRVIGDISADLEGAIECTVKITDPGEPYFVYDPLTEAAVPGVEGDGVVVMSVDILPSEFPRDASLYFGGVLRNYIPLLASADYSVPFEKLDLPPELKRAVIVYRGELTPPYKYLEKYL